MADSHCEASCLLLAMSATSSVSTLRRMLAGYESLTGKLVKLLERLKNREVSPDYTYYGIASPWLQVYADHCQMLFAAFWQQL